ncbi:MAG: PhoPQ-activated protein PqaA family protein, partial [Blastocatellia bacterium]
MKSINTRLSHRFSQTILCASVIALLFVSASAQRTALDRYIAKPDPVYSWKLVNTTQGEGYKSFVLELTSQRWRTEKDVDRPVWKHWLTIVKPDLPSTNKALLFIGGGSNNDKAPAAAPERVTMFA